jgi:hypothetical protein
LWWLAEAVLCVTAHISAAVPISLCPAACLQASPPIIDINIFNIFKIFAAFVPVVARNRWLLSGGVIGGACGATYLPTKKNAKKNVKNIQHQGFAGRHRPNY